MQEAKADFVRLVPDEPPADELFRTSSNSHVLRGFGSVFCEQYQYADWVAKLGATVPPWGASLSCTALTYA
jgi:hypothetical protein